MDNISLETNEEETILEKIEEDLKLDEERILNALNKVETEKSSPHTEVWKRLGV